MEKARPAMVDKRDTWCSRCGLRPEHEDQRPIAGGEPNDDEVHSQRSVRTQLASTWCLGGNKIRRYSEGDDRVS